MKRLCLYSATGIHGVVPKTEPRRAAFNAALLKYETLQRTYTAQKLRKPLAKERPHGRVTRTGFTVEEINAMFNIAINLIDNSGTRVEPPIGEVAITSVGFSEAEAHRALQHTRAHTGVK